MATHEETGSSIAQKRSFWPLQMGYFTFILWLQGFQLPYLYGAFDKEMSNQIKNISTHHPEPISAKELRDILATHETFAKLSDSAFAALAGIADRVFIPGGTFIIKSGEAIEDAFIVEYGRVRLNVGEKSALNGGRGETIGLLAVLMQKPFVGDFFALRDTKLIRLRGSELLQVMAANPELIVALARYADDALRRSLGIRGSINRPQAYAVLPTSADPRMRQVAESLFQALNDTAGPGSLVDNRRLHDICGRDVSEASAFESARNRLINWCEEQEAQGRFLLFVCDPSETSWTRWCLNQTDRIVLITDAEATDMVDGINRKFADHTVAGAPVRVDLMLVQKQGADQPRGTGAWMKLACRQRHYHVRLGHTTDFQRAARRMSARPLGVVLGGGGARGFAHLGVLQALEEAGVPIDIIGGTSMGAVMAGCYARGRSPHQILDVARNFFTHSRALIDLDFPMVSILRGRKLDNLLKSLFGDMDISDLWLPYYCISSSISKGQMILHDRGLLWQSVRASCSLPGVFPPVQTDGQLLVDGGLVDNVPTTIMEAQCEGGKIIAVDVGIGDAEFVLGRRKNISGWGLLRERLSLHSSRKRFANIFQILVQSTTFSSKWSMHQLLAKKRADLVLTPPVNEYQVLSFEAHEKLFEIGDEYTQRPLAAREGLPQIAKGNP
jgi:NTE family protein/lysophospholipid hydrolase